MRFIMVDGKAILTLPLYKEAVEVLYGLSISLNMNKGRLSQRDILIRGSAVGRAVVVREPSLLITVLLEEGRV